MGTSVIQSHIDDDGVATLTLHRPDRRNALSEALGLEFNHTLRQLASNERVGAIVLTGSGNHFSAGGDLAMLEWLTTQPYEICRSFMHHFYGLFLQVCRIDTPVIAAVEGVAVGAGLCLVAASDRSVASTQSHLHFNFMHLGLHPGMGATYLVERTVGARRAFEFLVGAQPIAPTAALHSGLVSTLVEPGAVLAEAKLQAKAIAALPQGTVRETKKSMWAGHLTLLDRALAREADAQAKAYQTDAFKKRIAALASKTAQSKPTK